MKPTKVFVNGTFDVLHYGHFKLLEAAAELGDMLYVAIDTDERVREKKGDNRPFSNLNDLELPGWSFIHSDDFPVLEMNGYIRIVGVYNGIVEFLTDAKNRMNLNAEDGHAVGVIEITCTRNGIVKNWYTQQNPTGWGFNIQHDQIMVTYYIQNTQ